MIDPRGRGGWLVPVAILAGALVPALPLRGQTGCAQGEIAIVASRDGTLYEDASGGLANGQGDYLFAGTTQAARVRRGLLAFDVASSVAPGSTVHAATLRLNLSLTVVGPRNVSLHRLLADWGEGSSDASGGEGAGTSAAAGDATWLHRFFPGSPWANPGGDFALVPSATAAVDGVGAYVWGSTPQMVADVQSWIDAPAGNHGWLLAGDETSAPSAKRFVARELGSDGPLLCVAVAPPSVVEVPALGALGLLLLAGVLAAVAARRLAATRRPG
jgi:hypothetical protein